MTFRDSPPWHDADVTLRASALRFHPPRTDATSNPRAGEGGDHFAHMFVDDLTMGIFPVLSRRRDGDAPSVTLEVHGDAPSDRVEKLVRDALAYDGHRYGSFPLPDVIRDWSRWCAQALLRAGGATYELGLAYRGDSERPVAFAVMPIRSGAVRRRFLWFGEFVQVVPQGSELDGISLTEGRRTLSAQLVRLPQARLIRVQLPPELRFLRTTVRKLRMLSEDMYPDFFLPLPGTVRRVPADFAEFLRSGERAVAVAARESGWNARGNFSKRQTDYYFVARELRFARTKIALRNFLLCTINSILDRVGPELGFRAQVRANGLPSLDDVAEAEKRVADGSEVYRSLMDRFQ